MLRNMQFQAISKVFYYPVPSYLSFHFSPFHFWLILSCVYPQAPLLASVWKNLQAYTPNNPKV
jgi:hypothetical protein